MILHRWLLVLLLMLSACQTVQNNQLPSLENFYEEVFQAELHHSPETMSEMGIKKDYDKLDNISEAALHAEHIRFKGYLAKLKTFDTKSLTMQQLLSYELFRDTIKNKLATYKFRHHNFPVNQMFGIQANTPSFFINVHKIINEQDANDYISRIKALELKFNQLLENLKIRERKGIIPPYFVFDKVIDDSQRVISGFPFEEKSPPSVLYRDFKNKINKINLDKNTRSQLLKRCEQALKSYLEPGYRKLITYMKYLKPKAPEKIGAWSLPDGDNFYKFQLQQITTTSLSPTDIHQLGRDEIDRIHQEMDAIRKKVNFTGSLNQFFNHMRNSEDFYYPQTDSGKMAYLKATREIITNIQKVIPQVFGLQPKAGLIVKPVEAFREASAGIAFYNAPSLDGSRPGIYYVNLYDLKQVPRFEMEALAYHEAIPGHHFERTISQELEKLPQFRRFGRYTAFIEGWGLYSEYLPKELGFYSDPYSDFGRLSMELWRATRLVVDTGIHWKRWTREEAIDYLRQTTPASEGEIVKAVERYFVMPGQATAYKIGMLKILELRERSQKALGEKFSLKAFHNQILGHGPLPLHKLERVIHNWISQQEQSH